MPVHPPYTDPAITAARSRASNDVETLGSAPRATDAKLEFVETAKFFGSLMIIHMLTGLGVVLAARLMA